jgi:hypothetical protein
MPGRNQKVNKTMRYGRHLKKSTGFIRVLRLISPDGFQSIAGRLIISIRPKLSIKMGGPEWLLRKQNASSPENIGREAGAA